MRRGGLVGGGEEEEEGLSDGKGRRDHLMGEKRLRGGGWDLGDRKEEKGERNENQSCREGEGW